jgi:hypothetical protein
VSRTDLHETLSAVADAVVVPPPDRLGVERRVRRARRRRAVGGALVAAAVVAAAVLAWPRGEAPAPVSPVGGESVPVVVGGELGLVSPGGSLERTGLRLQRVVGVGKDGVVGIGPDGDLVEAQVGDDGLGEVRTLADGPVRDAAASTYGSAVAWVDEDRTLHLPGATETGFRGDLLATDGDDWLVWRDGRVVLERPKSGRQSVLLSGERAVSAAILGPFVALGEADGRRLSVDADTGEVLSVHRGPVGALGFWWTDGATYVVAAEGGARTLWRCAPGCREVYRDPTGTLTIPGQE